MAASQFVGTWKLVSQQTHQANSTISNSRGEGAIGILMYEANGYMAVQLMRTDSVAAQFVDRTQLDNALSGFLSYFGKYEVHEAEAIVIHHVEGATYPGYQGVDLVRSYIFVDDLLTLTAESQEDGSHRVLVWQRAV